MTQPPRPPQGDPGGFKPYVPRSVPPQQPQQPAYPQPQQPQQPAYPQQQNPQQPQQPAYPQQYPQQQYEEPDDEDEEDDDEEETLGDQFKRLGWWPYAGLAVIILLTLLAVAIVFSGGEEKKNDSDEAAYTKGSIDVKWRSEDEASVITGITSHGSSVAVQCTQPLTSGGVPSIDEEGNKGCSVRAESFDRGELVWESKPNVYGTQLYTAGNTIVVTGGNDSYLLDADDGEQIAHAPASVMIAYTDSMVVFAQKGEGDAYAIVGVKTQDGAEAWRHAAGHAAYAQVSTALRRSLGNTPNGFNVPSMGDPAASNEYFPLETENGDAEVRSFSDGEVVAQSEENITVHGVIGDLVLQSREAGVDTADLSAAKVSTRDTLVWQERISAAATVRVCEGLICVQDLEAEKPKTRLLNALTGREVLTHSADVRVFVAENRLAVVLCADAVEKVRCPLKNSSLSVYSLPSGDLLYENAQAPALAAVWRKTLLVGFVGSVEDENSSGVVSLMVIPKEGKPVLLGEVKKKGVLSAAELTTYFAAEGTGGAEGDDPAASRSEPVAPSQEADDAEESTSDELKGTPFEGLPQVPSLVCTTSERELLCGDRWNIAKYRGYRFQLSE